jgi:hypothetical protein
MILEKKNVFPKKYVELRTFDGNSQRFNQQKTGSIARKAANELDDYFVQVKQLIETTYVANNNTQVLLISCTVRYCSKRL